MRIIVLLALLMLPVWAQAPKFDAPMPSARKTAAMGWQKFQEWCYTHCKTINEAQLDDMSRYYVKVRAAETPAKVTPEQVLELDEALDAVRSWKNLRIQVKCGMNGGSLYGHLGVRLEAELADLRARCLGAWTMTGKAAPDRWKGLKSFQQMGGEGDREELKQEAEALQAARAAVDKLPVLPAEFVAHWVVELASSISPSSR